MEKNKMYAVGAAVAVIVIIGILLMRLKSRPSKSSVTPNPTEAVIPTVDSSVTVGFTPQQGGHEIDLSAKNIPQGTQTIDYELSYQTKQQGLQGVIGTATIDQGGTDFEKKITLGTCSSGKCVYHEVVGKIKLTLRFNGNYGQRIFVSEYGL